MADQVASSGKLIAIDGTRGKDLAAAADAMVAALQARGLAGAISRWDASGLFGELAASNDDDGGVSARTLMLLYAADLAFRVRWEIRPILEAGGIVIAAPYIDTASAIGEGCGLDDEWTRQLLRFAPRPDFRARSLEKRIDKGWKAKLNRGFGEYCAAMSHPRSDARGRKAAMALLHRSARRKVYRLDDDGAAALAVKVIGSQRASLRSTAVANRRR